MTVREGTVEIRDARAEEMDAASEVMLAAYQQYMPARPHPAMDAYRTDIADVHGRAPFAELIVALDGDRIVGAVTYYPDGSASVEGWDPGTPSIRLLAVHPDARRRGIGRSLTEECIRRARTAGATQIGLHTTEMMAIARAMYERMGFERVPERDFRPAPEILVMGYMLRLG